MDYEDIDLYSWDDYDINQHIFGQETSSREMLFAHKVVFIVGTTHRGKYQTRIEEESMKFDDIIQENFRDTYNNLAVKSLMMLKWFTNNCINKGEY